MTIELAKKEDASAIASIHQQEIMKGFLSSLGPSFLKRFYEALVKSPYSFCLIACEGNEVVGFASGVIDMKGFYRYFFSRYFLSVVPKMVGKLFSFSMVRRVVENLMYPKKTSHLPKAELLSIAVKREFQHRGIGGQLLEEFVQHMRQRNVSRFKVLVGKELAAVDFYRKHQFKEVGEIMLHGNQSSYIFTYTL